MKDTLFSIVGEMQELYLMATEAIDEAETEEEKLTAIQAFNDTLDSLKGDLSTKSAGYAAVRDRLKAEQKRAKEIKDRYADIEDNRKKALAHMDEVLMIAMDKLKTDKLPAGDVTIRIIKNGGVQPLTITGDVPDNMTKITVEPDNSKIREFLKDQPDNACEWAHLEERGRHITIK